MKAISIHPYYAQAIVTGLKTVEVRSWRTDYRGDIVICSTAKKLHGTIPGHALGIVKIMDCIPLQRKHMKDALMRPAEYRSGLYAWILDDNRLIIPQPVKGRLSLWNYTGKLDLIPFEEWAEDTGASEAWIDKYWRHLMT